MRKVLTTVFATAVALSAAAPASAEPASSSSAAAYGISAGVLGTTLVPPTPSVAVSQPPDTSLTLGDNVEATVPVDLQGLAVSGTVFAVGEAHRADDIVPTITGSPGPGRDPVTLTGVNSRGFAGAERLNVAGNIPLIELLGGAVVPQGLVTADLVQAEAVAKCVNNQPVFETGYTIAELEVAGSSEIIPLNPLLAPLLAALNLPGVVTVTQGETGTLPGGGVFINALHISVPLLGADIIVGHAEAAMPANCGIAPPAPPAPPTGPGGIAPITADLGTLAATGGDFSVTPLVAMAMLGGALGIRRLTVRAQRSSSTVA